MGSIYQAILAEVNRNIPVKITGYFVTDRETVQIMFADSRIRPCELPLDNLEQWNYTELVDSVRQYIKEELAYAN